MSLLSIKELTIAPLNPVSASLDPGSMTMLCGKSGCGKSRLLYGIADLLPHRGELILNHIKASSINPSQWRQQVMLLPSQIEWWHATIEEHFVTPPSPSFLQRLNLEASVLNSKCNTLSTGQRQRLGILRTLDRNPTILLLDEPTANLDEENTIAVEQLLKQWVAEGERAILWCSHDQQQIARLATHVWEVNQQSIQVRSNP